MKLVQTMSEKDVKNIRFCPGCGHSRHLHEVNYFDCISIECDGCDYHILLRRLHEEDSDETESIHEYVESSVETPENNKEVNNKKSNITGKVNFILQAYSFNDFLRDMDRNNCEVINVKRSFTSYVVTVRGTNKNLDHARWFFRNCGSLV